MLKALRSGLTYANVVATGALFLALGGGAYALSGIPEQAGVYHGCVATSGALRVVTTASSCAKAKTVKRGNRRVRIPGESAITWNRQGPPGQSGINGTPGQPGTSGQPGSPAASTFTSHFRNQEGLQQTVFGPVSGIGPQSAETEAAVQMASPAVPIVARDLFAEYANESGALPGSTRAFTLVINGADSALTCTFTRPAESCSNTHDAVTIPAGSLLSIKFFQAGTSIGQGDVIVAWRGTTP
jgi:hypothetical protein